MSAETYPLADTTRAWFGNRYRGDSMHVNVGVVHTTECMTLPGYEGGATAPTLTAVPNFTAKRIDWVQHFEIDRSARALVNKAGGDETNTLNVLQIELVGTCDARTKKAWEARGHVQDRDFIYWPDAPDWALRDVGVFVAWCYTEHGVPMVSTSKPWLPYPSSYGTRGGQRMDAAEWNDFRGWCGHQHVVENLHGDPGAFPMATVLRYAVAAVGGGGRGASAPTPAVVPTGSRKVVVARGMTLAAIAATAGVGINALLGANPQIEDPAVIHPGDVVTVPPVAHTTAPTHPAPAPSPKPTASGSPGHVVKAPTHTAPAPRHLRVGSRGDDVLELARDLAAAGYLPPHAVSSTYSTAIADAVNALVRVHGNLGAADNTAGPLTQHAADVDARRPVATPKRALHLGERGDDVLLYERALVRLGLLNPKYADGYFGTTTRRATDAYVGKHRRLAPADGTAGPKTQGSVRGL